jgi:hypothetical protein
MSFVKGEFSVYNTLPRGFISRLKLKRAGVPSIKEIEGYSSHLWKLYRGTTT